MAVKAPVNVRRLDTLAYAISDTADHTVGEALRGLARYLDDHPYTILIGMNINYAVSDEENYLVAFIDGVEDNELT